MGIVPAERVDRGRGRGGPIRSKWSLAEFRTLRYPCPLHTRLALVEQHEPLDYLHQPYSIGA